MFKLFLLCTILNLALADRFTDFNSHYVWWTDLDSVNSEASGFRRMCFVGLYENECESIGTWDKMRSMALPDYILPSYNGTVSEYPLCRAMDITGAYYRFGTPVICTSPWVPTTTVRLITNTNGWPSSFTVGSKTWIRRDYKVYTNTDSDLIVLSQDLPPNPDIYSLKLSFSAYF